MPAFASPLADICQSTRDSHSVSGLSCCGLRPLPSEQLVPHGHAQGCPTLPRTLNFFPPFFGVILPGALLRVIWKHLGMQVAFQPWHIQLAGPPGPLALTLWADPSYSWALPVTPCSLHAATDKQALPLVLPARGQQSLFCSKLPMAMASATLLHEEASSTAHAIPFLFGFREFSLSNYTMSVWSIMHLRIVAAAIAARAKLAAFMATWQKFEGYNCLLIICAGASPMRWSSLLQLICSLSAWLAVHHRVAANSLA